MKCINNSVKIHIEFMYTHQNQQFVLEGRDPS